jgi:two-component system OmpR family response regulator/two-component system response regulator QseB
VRVLVVEDDPLLGDALHTGLRELGNAVDWMRDGVSALAALQIESYDAVVLDLGLPRLSGLDLLERLRDRDDRTPVLILTARDTVTDRIRGLDGGADDYLVKPFDMGELAARLRAIVRRRAGQSAPQLKVGAVVGAPCGCRDRARRNQLRARPCAADRDGRGPRHPATGAR